MKSHPSPSSPRRYWLDLMLKTARPVFESLAGGCLRSRMPVEQHADSAPRAAFAQLEALGRSLAGLAPWLALTGGDEEELRQRRDFLNQLPEALRHAVDPGSPDVIDFAAGPQMLVDAAFLAQGFLRSWEVTWVPLDDRVKAGLIEGMRTTRRFKAPMCNWLLFSAMVEAFLCRAGADWDPEPVDFALHQHENWYKGDGVYGDGKDFHWDYYNSFVIQPMICDLLRQPGEIGDRRSGQLEKALCRSRRYAAVQERMIAPDGSFPPLGRSLTYRFGVFQLLGQMALLHELPPELDPPAVRCALTAALRRCMGAEGTFDGDGWLRIGLCGHQPALGETYISTGALYLTLCGFLPLGLPPEDPFWSGADQPWTSLRIWSGENMAADHAISD